MAHNIQQEMINKSQGRQTSQVFPYRAKLKQKPILITIEKKRHPMKRSFLFHHHQCLNEEQNGQDQDNLL